MQVEGFVGVDGGHSAIIPFEVGAAHVRALRSVGGGVDGVPGHVEHVGPGAQLLANRVPHGRFVPFDDAVAAIGAAGGIEESPLQPVRQRNGHADRIGLVGCGHDRSSKRAGAAHVAAVAVGADAHIDEVAGLIGEDECGGEVGVISEIQVCR